MPLWIIYHPENTFTTLESKQALSESITKLYAEGPSKLPAFYVSVNFVPLSPTSMFVGGVPRPSASGRPFIRFMIDQIAVRLPNEDGAYETMTDRIDAALREHVEGKGWDWEYHVAETERRLWKVNGIKPPALGSDGEDLWRREGRAVAFE